jgi:ketosteroid isomerase-like protein
MIAKIPTGRPAVAMAVIAGTFSLAAAFPHPAHASETLPADLARAVDAYNRATTHNDTKTLAALVTEDYVLVNSDASLQDKASYLKDFGVPGFKVDPYEIEPLTYKVRGETALTAWTVKLGWTLDGRHETRRLRMAHYWMRRDGRWRIAYTQLTRIPE